MAKRNDQPKHPWQVWHKYPEPKESRSGTKVSWNYYETEAEAKACSEAAKHNAQIQLAAGYDFGYCSPGSVRRPYSADYAERANRYHPDLFEVCLP